LSKKNFGRETCAPCDGKIKFGKECWKCQDCGIVCHRECKANAPLPCIRGITRTPTNKGGVFLADYAPVEAPMVPPLLQVCVEEINRRGLREVGIYRLSGADAEARELLDKLTHGKGPTPDLSKYDIHAVCSCVKKFLKSLKEPIIPLSLWQVFVDAATETGPDTIEQEAAVYQAISELPLPNRDTLAYLILHLQNVAENKSKNQMNVDNLAVVWAPTIVGYSSNDPVEILAGPRNQQQVMKVLLKISSDYWNRLLEPKDSNLFNYLKPSSTPETRMFAPLISNHSSGNPKTGGPAKRTRSRTDHARTLFFQSPMIN